MNISASTPEKLHWNYEKEASISTEQNQMSGFRNMMCISLEIVPPLDKRFTT